VVVGEATHSIIAGGAEGIVNTVGHSIGLKFVSHWVEKLKGAPLTANIRDLHSDVSLGVGALDSINWVVVVVVWDVVQENARGVFIVRGLR
jgi:hypothetical protein